MTRYELILEAENNPLFFKLLQKGLIPLSVLDRKCYYEKYKEELKKNDKVQAISNASEDFKVHENTIRNAINIMES